MTVAVNRQVVLAARPFGLPKVSDFQLGYTSLPSPAAGEVLVRLVYLSLDPYMRGLMNESDSAGRPIALGEVMTGGAVGFVLESADPAFCVGDTVEGMLGWQEYAVARASKLRKVDLGVARMSMALGVLGMPGLAAYFGLLDICHPQAGETVVVSGAAGAVGMVAGQVAKLRGCRVVGLAGSGAKAAWLVDELGFDAAWNYKFGNDIDGKLRACCPAGVDVYFDNVGGEITDAVVRHLNPGARISLCGQISQYNLEVPESGPRWLGELTAKEAKAQGFLVSGYIDRYPEGCHQLTQWLDSGKLKYREDVAQGIEAAPQAFIGMLQGRNEGKQLVQLTDL
ncbi:MAG: NADP-dependent oxidoreductase [Thermoanaerobaculia bacterium]